jgi:NADH-quinone oxidoreductase subunit N
VFAAAYVAMNLGAFAVVMVVGRELRDLDGLGRTHPVLAVALVVFLLSLTGIPPLFGFVGKLYLFTAAINAGFLWLAVIGILNSVLSLAVYLRLVVPMGREPAGASAAMSAPFLLRGVIAAALMATLGLGILAALLPG